MNADDLVRRVRETISSNQMILRGDRIVCAVSGGPDSVCMVTILTEMRDDLGFEMVLAHVNYRTRGEDSDLEEKLCRRLAKDREMKVFVRSVEPNELEELKNGNFQRDASRLRYAFFRQIAASHDCRLIATGHTANDVAESVLMHAIRGAGLAGLGGIYPTHNNSIRPLIDCYREDIISFLTEMGIPFRIDKSNLACEYIRNRIRNELMPHLEAQYNSQIAPALVRTAHVSQEADEFIRKHTERLWSKAVTFSRFGKVIIDLGRYKSADRIVCYELIRRAFQHFMRRNNKRTSLDLDLIREAHKLVDSEVGRRADLNNGVFIERGVNQLVLFEDAFSGFVHDLTVPGIARLSEIGIEISSVLSDFDANTAIQADNWSVELDYEKLSPPFHIRNAREADRVKLLNAPGSRKLSDIFSDRKIPRSLRHEVPILTAGYEIVWIIGVGIAHIARITEQTGKVLKLHAKSDVIQESDV